MLRALSFQLPTGLRQMRISERIFEMFLSTFDSPQLIPSTCLEARHVR